MIKKYTLNNNPDYITKILLKEPLSLLFDKINPIIKHCQNNNVKNILEIGTFAGGTAYKIAQKNPTASVVSIDINKFKDFFTYHENTHIKEKILNYYKKYNIEIYPQDIETIQQIYDATLPNLKFIQADISKINVERFDVAIIDGDHTIDGLEIDLKTIYNKNKNCVMFIDDSSYNHITKTLEIFAQEHNYIVQGYCPTQNGNYDLIKLTPIRNKTYKKGKNMKKTALLLGCGSKWGAVFTDELLKKNYEIDLITSTGIEHEKITNHIIDWWNSDTEIIDKIVDNLKTSNYDLVFFNQNSGGGLNEHFFSSNENFPVEHWNKSTWINCQLAYYMVKKLGSKIKENTKIGWMLTGLIDSTDSNFWQYVGYASVKATNLYIMRGFAKFCTGIFFGMQPIWFPAGDEKKDAINIIDIIENLTAADSGKILTKEGTEWQSFCPRTK